MLCNLVYHEQPAEPSPYAYICGLSPAEKAKVFLLLELLMGTPIGSWQYKWLSILEDKIWQLRSGDHRVLFFLAPDTIVVVHALRKTGRTIKPQDLNLAKRRRRDYFENAPD